jgi:hypothetical protein
MGYIQYGGYNGNYSRQVYFKIAPKYSSITCFRLPFPYMYIAQVSVTPTLCISRCVRDPYHRLIPVYCTKIQQIIRGMGEVTVVVGYVCGRTSQREWFHLHNFWLL